MGIDRGDMGHHPEVTHDPRPLPRQTHHLNSTAPRHHGGLGLGAVRLLRSLSPRDRLSPHCDATTLRRPRAPVITAAFRTASADRRHLCGRPEAHREAADELGTSGTKVGSHRTRH